MTICFEKKELLSTDHSVCVSVVLLEGNLYIPNNRQAVTDLTLDTDRIKAHQQKLLPLLHYIKAFIVRQENQEMLSSNSAQLLQLLPNMMMKH